MSVCNRHRFEESYSCFSPVYLKSCLADMSDALLVCGIPYLMPTPTRGKALITFFTVAWSAKANIIDAAKAENYEDENDNIFLRFQESSVIAKIHLKG